MKERPAKTYDEITRRTVVQPDGAFASPAAEGPGLADAALRARVYDALLAAGLDVGFAVAGGVVTLRGFVRDQGQLARIEHIVGAVEGVDHVESRMHVGNSS